MKKFVPSDLRTTAFLLGMLIGAANASGAWADVLDNQQTVDGITVYLGVMPAAIIRGHPSQHPEATMHGGPGSGWDRHVVVALFDARTFDRITDADITATVEGLGHVGRTTKKLERMVIADTVSFGGYFPFQGIDRYSIELKIKLANRPKEVTVAFRYET